MNKDILLRWDTEHQAMKRSMNGFWETFTTWREENREEYLDLFSGQLLDEFVRLEERAIFIKYNYNTGETGEAVVFCSIHIFYVDTQIGTYDVEFFLNGEVADDYLNFEDERLQDRLVPVKHSLRIARNALKLGMQVEDISRLTDLPAKYIEVLKAHITPSIGAEFL